MQNSVVDPFRGGNNFAARHISIPPGCGYRDQLPNPLSYALLAHHPLAAESSSCIVPSWLLLSQIAKFYASQYSKFQCIVGFTPVEWELRSDNLRFGLHLFHQSSKPDLAFYSRVESMAMLWGRINRYRDVQ